MTAPTASPNDIPMSLATSAFNNTSHFPERGAEIARRDYAVAFNSWAKQVSCRDPQEGTREQLAEVIAETRVRFLSAYKAWLSAHSRCASAFICGPANFPVNSNRKKMDTADRRWADAMEVLAKAGKRIHRRFWPLDHGISSDREDAGDLLREKLAGLEQKQEWMKRANALVRKALKDEAPVQWLAPRLVELGKEFGHKFGNDGIPAAARILTPDCMGDVGFPSYALKNNNANIRRVRQRIAEIEARAEQETTERTAGDVQIVDNVEANRLQLFFPGKPDHETRTKLKKRGFRWSPKNGCWQRMRGPGAEYAANEVLGEAA